MKNILWVATFALVFSICADAQTIADVARRERARPQPPSSVTITNANLKKKATITTTATTEEKKPGEAQAPAPAAAATPATAGNAAAVNTAAAAPTPKQASGQTPPAADTRDEKYWREKFDAARTDIRRAENQVALAQLELNSANRDYITRSYDPDGRGLSSVAAATKKLEDANKAVTTGRTKLTQLEDDLRRSGAPAGWAR